MASLSPEWVSPASLRALIRLESCGRQAVRCQSPAVQTFYCFTKLLERDQTINIHTKSKLGTFFFHMSNDVQTQVSWSCHWVRNVSFSTALVSFQWNSGSVTVRHSYACESWETQRKKETKHLYIPRLPLNLCCNIIQSSCNIPG